MGAEFVRGRVCQGPSLLWAKMSRNHLRDSEETYYLHLHRYVVRSQLTFTQRVDFGW